MDSVNESGQLPTTDQIKSAALAVLKELVRTLGEAAPHPGIGEAAAEQFGDKVGAALLTAGVMAVEEESARQSPEVLVGQ